MKIKRLLDNFINMTIERSLLLIVYLTSGLPLSWIMSILNLYGGCFYLHFKKQFRAESGKFHMTGVCNVHGSMFISEYIKMQLFSQYLRRYLFSYSRGECEKFISKIIQTSSMEANENLTKLYLCTHSGDYWLSILNIAYQCRDRSSTIKQLIVPIYEPVNEKNSHVFAKIKIPDMKVIFIHIHEPGALKKIMVYLRDDLSAVAMFYDLFCYAAGTFNGSVESVKLFNKPAYMTTGISSLVVRLNLPIKFVSTHYCRRNNKFITSISDRRFFDNAQALREDMVSYLEDTIRKYPAQWHFISNLDTFYHYPFSQLQSIQQNKINSYHRLHSKFLA